MERIISFISTLVSLIADSLALIFSFTILCLLILRTIQAKLNRIPNVIDVPLILSINILCIMIGKILIQTSHITYPSMKTYLQNRTSIKNDFSCHVRAYRLWCFIGILYWNYALLTFFRFARIIYSQHKYLHRLSSYLYVFVPLIVLIILLLILPVFLISSGIQITPTQPYCDVVFKPVGYIVYIGVIVFVIPYGMICMFYFCIARFLRRTTTISLNQERNRRDYRVIKRIVLNVIILGIVSTPGVILIILYNIDNRFEDFTYSITWPMSSIAALIFTIIFPFITTKLCRLVKRNEVIPVVENLQ